MTKRERTHYDGCWRSHHECAVIRVEQLEAIVAKLPKTADGVPVVPTVDEVWICYRGETPAQPTMCTWRLMDVRGDECYSTREAAEGEAERAIERAEQQAAEAAGGE
ncbi:MAG: hypothetical protein GY838_03760 [bacterium]|nr:hypothetical protein [bacterium]